MSVPNSTPQAKPSKPYPEFPLFPHATKRWAKKIRGKLEYFGSWADGPDAALENYLKQKDVLHSGRHPVTPVDTLEIKHLVNSWLIAKDDLVDAGELSPLTRSQYQRIADELVAHLGKHRLVDDIQPNDFTKLRDRMAKKWGPHLLRKAIQYVRSIFKHGYEAGLTEKPMRFGPGFKRPTMKVMRVHRAKQGVKLFTVEEIRLMLDALAGKKVTTRHKDEETGELKTVTLRVNLALRAMVLLGANCGFGNSDVGNLPFSAVDLDRGWIHYPRPKTGIERRCPLWPETVAALREAIDARPAPEDETHAGLVFVTKYGKPWAKDIDDSPVTKETSKLLHKLGINGRKGLGFYTLRSTFRTAADESKDQPACDHIMGHEPAHMSSVYRQKISDERLQAVAAFVRAWLFK